MVAAFDMTAFATSMSRRSATISGPVLQAWDARGPSPDAPLLHPRGQRPSAWFAHADQLIEQAAERTRDWLEGGGLSRPEIPNSLLPHSY
jgi:hypothetical protein